MINDPNNSMAREMPVNDYVKSKLEDEKQKKVLDKIAADNPVSIAEDFQIRKVSDEEIQKSQQQMSNSTSNSASNMQSNSKSNSQINSNRKNINK